MRELTTQRLLMRRWRAADRAPFAALNADPEVMRHFPATLTRRQSDDLAARIGAELVGGGWGLWALEERATGRFVGFTGLARPAFDAPFMPADYFDHPLVADERLRRHVLYRLSAPDWRSLRRAG